MSEKKRIVIIGATSSIAEHCARLWAEYTATEFTLVGRNPDRIERVAADLRVRSPESNVRVIPAEFLDASAIRHTVDTLVAENRVDIVLIAHGSLPVQSTCQEDLNVCRETLELNGISPVLYAEAFAMHMAKADHGTLVLIGSVAGDRGRKSNYVYGSAKGLVTRYAQGLQHRFSGTGVKVVLIKPGPTDTPMTAHMKNQGAKLASADKVAKQIVSAVARGEPVVYAPGKWQWIMLVIKHLPAFIFNKMNI